MPVAEMVRLWLDGEEIDVIEAIQALPPFQADIALANLYSELLKQDWHGARRLMIILKPHL